MACGGTGTEQGGEQLPDPEVFTRSFLLDVAADTPLGQVVAAEQQGATVERPAGFETGDLVAPASEGTVFDLDDAALDDAALDARTVALGAALGLSGDVERVEADRQLVGPDGALLVVNSPRGGDGGAFWFEGGADVSAGMAPCPTVPDGFCERDVAAAEPPSSTERAEQQIAEVMDVLGVEPEAYTVERFDQAASVEFAVAFAPNGQRSSVSWGFSVGSSGAVAAASGAFTAPKPAVDVALVDIDTAIDRLHAIHHGVAGIAPTTTMLAATPDAAASTTTLPTQPTLPMPPGSTAIPTTEPAATPPMGSREWDPLDLAESPSRRIVSVELGLQTLWESPSGPWVVPTFVFVADDGSEYGVVAVSAALIALVSPPTTMPPPTTLPPPTNVPPPTTAEYVPIPEPMPTLLTDDGTPVTIPVPPQGDTGSTDYYNQVLAEVLVGRDLASVVNTLEGTGWTVRVLDEDLDEFVDSDLRWDRANVLHRNEIVSGVYADPWTPGAVASSTTSTSTTTTAPPGPPPATTTTLDPPTGSDEWLDADGLAELQRSFEMLWIGQPIDSARGALESIGYIIRVVEPGGAVTLDFQPYRVNFTVTDGVIEAVWLG